MNRLCLSSQDTHEISVNLAHIPKPTWRQSTRKPQTQCSIYCKVKMSQCENTGALTSRHWQQKYFASLNTSIEKDIIWSGDSGVEIRMAARRDDLITTLTHEMLISSPRPCPGPRRIRHDTVLCQLHMRENIETSAISNSCGVFRAKGAPITLLFTISKTFRPAILERIRNARPRYRTRERCWSCTQNAYALGLKVTSSSYDGVSDSHDMALRGRWQRWLLRFLPRFSSILQHE